ncbi:MAG: TIGR03663 family protein [Acidobacteria bacterium]|nr:MAG: TIGR03663 family protein [Acidobacteriota bacterium]
MELIGFTKFDEMSFISGEKRKDRLFLTCACLVVALAFFFRFYQLTLKPLHHDEGVNGYFLQTLFQKGVYQYDPSNYHGPTLYYIALVFVKTFGLEDFSIRASVAIFGVLMVVMVLWLRRFLGEVGSLSAALFLAVTPGMVFISRYFIHETFFVFCSLAIVLCVLFFLEGKRPGIFTIATSALICFVCLLPALNVLSMIDVKNENMVLVIKIAVLAIESVFVFLLLQSALRWDEGRRLYLMLAAAFLALLSATKETAFITVGTMALAVFFTWVWLKIYQGIFASKLKKEEMKESELTWANFRQKIGSKKQAILTGVACLVVFLYVGAVFFSSFFTYKEGIPKAFEAYAFWSKTANTDHQAPMLRYLEWLWKLEYSLVVLSVLGIIIAFLKARNRFAIFTALWAFGLFLAYSLIPYKTPWLILSFLLPMCLISGYAINEIASNRRLSIVGLIVVLVACGSLLYHSFEINFWRYDDEDMPYVYAHTKRGYREFLQQIQHYAEKSGKGNDATIQIVTPEYWPLPWDLRNYNRANFYGYVVPSTTAELIVAQKDRQESEIMREYKKHYKYVGEYPLRPGVDFILLVRRDLADSNTKEINEALHYESFEKSDGATHFVPLFKEN